MIPEEISQPIAEVLTETFDAPIDYVLTANLDSFNNIYGTCLSGGNFYVYHADNYFIEAEYIPYATQEINLFVQGVLDANGIRVDSDRPFDWLLGFARFDAQVKCKSGNIPCGRRCIPRGQKCRITGGSGAKLKQAKSGLNPLGVAAGVAGAGVLAGAGTLAYVGRKHLKEGYKQAKSEIDKGVKEAKDLVEINREVAGATAIMRRNNARENAKLINFAEKIGVPTTVSSAKDLYAKNGYSAKEINQAFGDRSFSKFAKKAEKTIQNEKTLAGLSDEDATRRAMREATVKSLPEAGKRVARGIERGIKKGLTGRA